MPWPPGEQARFLGRCVPTPAAPYGHDSRLVCGWLLPSFSRWRIKKGPCGAGWCPLPPQLSLSTFPCQGPREPFPTLPSPGPWVRGQCLTHSRFSKNNIESINKDRSQERLASPFDRWVKGGSGPPGNLLVVQHTRGSGGFSPGLTSPTWLGTSPTRSHLPAVVQCCVLLLRGTQAPGCTWKMQKPAGLLWGLMEGTGGVVGGVRSRATMGPVA